MRSIIIRRDTGDDYTVFLKRLAKTFATGCQGGKMGKAGGAALVVLLTFGAPVAGAQTANHRFAVEGGVVLLDLVPIATFGEYTGWQMGGRAYMGRYVYAFGDVFAYFTDQGGGVSLGLAVVSSRSARQRIFLRGGFLVPFGLPLVGVGVEYGGDWGVIANWDYVPTRAFGEGLSGLSVLKLGVYWGREGR